jgi:MFS family permease
MTDDRSRTLRAILRTALLWSAAWALAGGAIMATLALFDPNPGIESLPERLGMTIFAGVAWGVRFGLAGAVIGAVFSAMIRLGYRGRRLADINPVRFALLGAVVGGVGVPLYLQTMNLLTDGRPIAWSLVTDDGVWASVFGAVVAAGSIMLARRADRLRAEPDHGQLEHGSGLSAMASPAPSEASVPQRSGSAD